MELQILLKVVTYSLTWKTLQSVRACLASDVVVMQLLKVQGSCQQCHESHHRTPKHGDSQKDARPEDRLLARLPMPC